MEKFETPIFRIALDYDGTASERPQMFAKWLEIAKQHRTLIVFVTMRFAPPQDNDIIPHIPDGSPVIYTGRLAKKNYVEDYLGLNFDVWIDDCPHFLFQEVWQEASNPTDKSAKNEWRKPHYQQFRTEVNHLPEHIRLILQRK